MEYNCNICKKNYSSYQTLWTHNKKFHTYTNVVNVRNVENVDTITTNPIILKSNKLICKFCKKIFKSQSNKCQHEKNVCNKKQKNTEIELEKLKIQKIKEEKELKDKDIELLKLKIELKNKSSIINTNNNTINNINNTKNETINNTKNETINNITINAMGDEIINKLTSKEIKNLADKGNNAIIHIVELLNFNGRFPENQYFCNTSLEGDYVTVYDTKTKKINKELKHEFYDKLLLNSYRKVNEVICNIEFNNDKLNIHDKYKEKLEESVNTVNVFNPRHKKIYKQNINQLSYNKKNIVLDTWTKTKPLTFDDLDDFSDED
jgi:hypothetical protein